MKNYLLLTASAVLVLSSCSNNEIVENQDLKTDGPKTMNFQTYVPGATRAINAQEATVVSVEEKGFYLFTDLTKLVQGKEEQVKGKMSFLGDDVWAMGEDQLEWPVDLNQQVHFYAVYTDKEEDEFNVVQTDDFGDVLRGFDANEGINDYMVAADTSNYKTRNGQVSLNFEHILAQVEVRIVGTVSGYKYEVGGVTITAPESKSLIMGEKSFVDENDTVVYKLDNSGISSNGTIYSNSTNLSDLTDNVYGKLMVVPGTCYLSMKYRIYGEDEGAPEAWESTGYYTDEAEPNMNNVDIESQETHSFEVLQGYNNIITIKLNPETRAMTFNVDVASWNVDPNADEGGQIIEL